MIVAAVVAAVVVAAAGVFWVRPERILTRKIRRQALVTCKDGSGFAGVLWSADRSCLVLKQASIVGTQAGATSIDGEVVILRADVAFIQLP